MRQSASASGVMVAGRRAVMFAGPSVAAATVAALFCALFPWAFHAPGPDRLGLAVVAPDGVVARVAGGLGLVVAGGTALVLRAGHTGRTAPGHADPPRVAGER